MFGMLCAVILSQGCGEGKRNALEYSRYVVGYTRGVIRSTDPIQVRLESGALDSLPVAAEELFRISPGASGTVSYRDRVFEFRPSGRLKNGQTYRVSLRLEMFPDAPAALKVFEFDARVMAQAFSFEEGGLGLEENGEEFAYRGRILNADMLEDEKEVERLVSASFHGSDAAVEWVHDDPYAHSFAVRRLARGDSRRVLRLTFRGEVARGGEVVVEVPARGSFTVLEARPGGADSRYVEIVMSDNVDASQYLGGLVRVEGIDRVTCAVEGNVVRVHAAGLEQLQDAVQVTACKGIRSRVGDKLAEDATLLVCFPSVAPKVQFIGKGTFAPPGENALVAFSAVGLKAVQLRVIKVFAQNMNFYLQENGYSAANARELVRVARPVVDRRIELAREGAPFNPNKWQDYTLNLSDFTTLEKGVAYRVELRFRRSFTALPCARDKEDGTTAEESWEGPRGGYDYDDYDDYYGYPDDFSWAERNDPCSNSYYYVQERFPWRHLVVTSLGVVAKAGVDGKYAVAVTDLSTAAPVEHCAIYFYNYQNQKIDSARTGADGIAVTKVEGKPFTVVARKGNDKAFLKVSDNLALSYSNFDVGGEVVQRGLKGFIYGERDAWRPGNDVYLSFILEDKEGTIPVGHPITAELYDPNGKAVQSKRETRDERGLYCFPFKTDKDAMTGYWRAVVKVGGATFSRSVRVETVKPNRLSVDIRLPGQVVGRDALIPVQTRWLHGAKTSLLETNTTLRLSQGATTFAGHEGYVFDENRYFPPTETAIFEGKTDAEGRFALTLDKAEAVEAPGMLNARLTTRVFENSGESSIVTASFKYSPYREYVGIKLPDVDGYWYPTGAPIEIRGIVVTPDGKLAGEEEIEVEVYAVRWRWWWDAEREHLASYVNRSYHSPVFQRTLRSVGGRFSCEVTCGEWGRYYAVARHKASGHAASTTFYARSGGQLDVPGMATLLALSSNKKSYAAGDKIEVSFPSSAGAVAIVSVENGRSVTEIFRVPTREKSTSFSITATEEMCPNVYVNVSLVQPHAARDNDKPIRLYGALNIPVESPGLRLQPRVEMDDELRPSKAFAVTVSEAAGKPMTYTLAVVDEGLLALTSFRTPDPFPVFYAREALGVRTWDFYDEVAGAFGGRLEKALAVGGSDELSDDGKRKSDRFTPVVIFRGPFTLQPGEKKKHELEMPEYIGEVRTMVVAVDNGRYGSAEKRARVNAPLMLNVTMPRLFTPGDAISIPVAVFAMKDNIKEVSVEIAPDRMIELVGPARQEVHFRETGEQVVFFDVRIRENTGRSTIAFEATSGTERARFATDVEIRVPNPRVARVDAREIKPGETIAFDNAVEGIDPLAALEITSIPPLNLEQRLGELIRYPHGCGEQITSSAYPQLMLDGLTEMTDGQRVSAELHVKEVIHRLRNYQVSDGGFAYWPGVSSASDWVSSYIADFLVHAEKQGYLVPATMKNAAIAYLDKLANAWRVEDYYAEIEQSYRLYVLAAAGRPNLAAMNRMKEIDYKNPVARWQLAGAFAAANRPDVARSLVANLPAEASLYRQTGRCYGSDLRDNAIILQAMIDMDKREEAYKLLQKMALRFSSGDWLSTQESAFGLRAIGNYVKRYFASGNGVSVSIDNAPLATSKTVATRPLEVRGQRARASVKNNAGGILHARLVSSSIPLGVITTGESSGLKMTATYRRDKEVVREHRYRQGEDVTVELSLTNTGSIGRYDELALSYLFPSGFEFHNERLINGVDPFPGADHADIRDDRLYLYLSLGQGETKTFKLRFNAAYPGAYLLPAITCAAMYDNTITATLPGATVSIACDE
jgi:uncharacterized protein YfaS (alpha-2-macroglobulin family)